MIKQTWMTANDQRDCLRHSIEHRRRAVEVAETVTGHIRRQTAGHRAFSSKYNCMITFLRCVDDRVLSGQGVLASDGDDRDAIRRNPAGPSDAGEGREAADDQGRRQFLAEQKDAQDDRQQGGDVADGGDLTGVEEAERLVLRGQAAEGGDEGQPGDTDPGACGRRVEESEAGVGARQGDRQVEQRRR